MVNWGHFLHLIKSFIRQCTLCMVVNYNMSNLGLCLQCYVPLFQGIQPVRRRFGPPTGKVIMAEEENSKEGAIRRSLYTVGHMGGGGHQISELLCSLLAFLKILFFLVRLFCQGNGQPVALMFCVLFQNFYVVNLELKKVNTQIVNLLMRYRQYDYLDDINQKRTLEVPFQLQSVVLKNILNWKEKYTVFVMILNAKEIKQWLKYDVIRCFWKY